MAEHDNAGFPLSYCLLTTATAVDAGKRKNAIATWAKCVRDKYNVNPVFVHVDKDMAEIGASKEIWKAKINLCWWHLRRAVRTRLGQTKLATTPYNAKQACEEFDFIDAEFIPPNKKVDTKDYEGGLPEDAGQSHVAQNEAEIPARSHNHTLRVLGDSTNSLCIRLPLPSQAVSILAANIEQKENIDAIHAPIEPQTRIQGTGFVLLLKPPDDSISDNDDEEKQTRRTFCAPEHRQAILDMMERHYCAHPLIPGYSAPNPVAIKRWAVQQIYGFCAKNELPEVWAYLWENWYRKGRWELWARSAHETIPILKTTMILESQSVTLLKLLNKTNSYAHSWRRIKHEFLHHFKMPRCDLLAWILVTKLAPTYYIKLDNLLNQTGRYRELCSWRKEFKKIWRDLETREITMPINDAYRPDANKWICTCPFFVTSRFLICKHLVQHVHRVPPTFFLEVKRYRTPPFWRHKSLKVLDEVDESEKGVDDTAWADEDEDGEIAEGGEDDEFYGEDSLFQMEEGRTFEEAMNNDIDLIMDFLAGLKFQVQFRDQRMLNTLEREGAGFLRLAKACLEKERRLTRRAGNAPAMWEKSTITSMFYRARPADADMR